MIDLYAEICRETSFLFASTRILIFLALFAYFKVFIVSSFERLAGDTVAIITVLQLPPKLSFNIRVSLLSLNGTNEPFFVLSPNAFIQLASASSDVLILAPSINLIPLFSVTVPLSDPARSTKESLAQNTSSSVFLILSLIAN